MNGFLISVASFVVALGVLITVHEFGHFWVARRLGVKVLRFSIGFGKPLWTRRSGPDNTEYVIAALPLGGYVKMLDEREGEVDASELHRAFNRKPLAVRSAVVFAGPLFNLLFAVLAYWAIFVVGVTGVKPVVGEVGPDSVAAAAGLQVGDEIIEVAGRDTPTWDTVIMALLRKALAGDVFEVSVRNAQQETTTLRFDLSGAEAGTDRDQLLAQLGIRPLRPPLPAVIAFLEPGGVAERAGFAVGDEVIAADGQAIADWQAWVDYVRSRPERPIRAEVRRDGTTIVVKVSPAAVAEGENMIGRIGAGTRVPDELREAQRATLQYPPVRALGAAVLKTWDISTLTVRMLLKMLVGEASVENISGPITIADYAGQSASIGLVPFVEFLALISLSLGIINLLPIPVLDGGHLMYYLMEFIKGSPLSEAAQEWGQRVGIAILLALMTLAFYNDLARLLK